MESKAATHQNVKLWKSLKVEHHYSAFTRQEKVKKSHDEQKQDQGGCRFRYDDSEDMRLNNSPM